MSEDDSRAIELPSFTRDEKILEVSGTLVNLVPWLGGALGSILIGLSGDRRFERVLRFLHELDQAVGELTDAQGVYVRSEDFEDLLSETLPRVARERNEEKRRMYRDFLADAIEDPAGSYDEQLRFLRLLEQLQGGHIQILRALIQTPEGTSEMLAGSRMHTLKARLPELDSDRVEDLAQQLGDMRIIEPGMLGGLVTGGSAIDLRSTVTPLGSRFVKFLGNEEA